MLIQNLIAPMSLVCLVLALCDSQASAKPWVISTDFEGGSASVLEIDQANSHISIMPDGDPTRGWPLWWFIRVDGLIENQSLKISVFAPTQILPDGVSGAGKPLAGSWAMPAQATWSADGETWNRTQASKQDGTHITYELTSPGNQLWMAWGPPATPTAMNQWMDQTTAKHDSVRSFVLTKTREGREVRGLHVASGDLTDNTRPVIWLHARQHAWESGSSWVACGITQWLVGESEDAAWIRKHTEVFVVPILDVDRAATGDGGKESVPHDHNRDWSADPHYPEVAAVQNKIRQWSNENRLAVFVDLHNPSPNDREAFFYVASDESLSPKQCSHRDRFLRAVHNRYEGQIPLTRETRSTGPGYHPLWHRMSRTWVTQHANENAISVCLETPWNHSRSTTEGYESVGVSIAKGIAGYLQGDSAYKNTAD
ncbi:M14-type cytosolic carboxypeptidase [Rhodopirellula europaea]|jgi:hypothetical protein|uniref:Peptidase M14, carboxypeptidase A n=1 Tax=Rhodopirellula europaea SH398 TaxID=1263868 RepID=M5RVI8_9BACT|nr:M14-type cytosolic carboxypeptidase [Rhodopirellula europaea]EMI23353.1 Peptidase M14, carboxypeptidase A [Rhodopirellula europaea SH398]